MARNFYVIIKMCTFFKGNKRITCLFITRTEGVDPGFFEKGGEFFLLSLRNAQKICSFIDRRNRPWRQRSSGCLGHIPIKTWCNSLFIYFNSFFI